MEAKQLPKKILNFELQGYVGILTAGGPAPGLNATIQGFTYTAYERNYGVIGFHEGYKGLINGEFSILVPEALDPNRTHVSSINNINIIGVSNISSRSGSILSNSRTNLLKVPNGIEQAKKVFDSLGLRALACLGGDDTLFMAHELFKSGVKTVGAPKTIDNDVMGTDYCFGFDTAINAVMKIIRNLYYDAKATKGIIVVETMGRTAGWIALEAGMASGAHAILIPELYRAKVEDPDKYPELEDYRSIHFNIDNVVEIVKRRIARGKHYSIIVVAEGYIDEILEKIVEDESKDLPKDEFGHVRLDKLGISKIVADYISSKLNVRTRPVQTGYISRSAETSAFDSYMAINYGIRLFELMLEGNYGKMVVMERSSFVVKDLSLAASKIRYVKPWRFKNASKFWNWTLTG